MESTEISPVPPVPTAAHSHQSETPVTVCEPALFINGDDLRGKVNIYPGACVLFRVPHRSRSFLPEGWDTSRFLLLRNPKNAQE